MIDLESPLRRVAAVGIAFCISGRLWAQCEATIPQIPQRVLSTTAALRIGGGSDGPYSFSGIVAVARDRRGRLVVADGSTQQLRVFSEAGVFQRALSGRGDGPGELRNVSAISVFGDTLFAYEGPPGLPRANIYRMEAGFVSRSMLRVENTGALLTGLARTSTGAVLVAPGAMRAFQPPALGETQRDSVSLALYASPEAVKRLGRFADVTWVGVPVSGAPVPSTAIVHPIAPGRAIAVAGSTVWIGDAATGDIQSFRSDGSLRASARIRGARSFSSRQAVEKYWVYLLNIASLHSTEGINYLAAKSLLPERPPVFSRLVAGEADDLWIVCFALPGVERGRAILLGERGVPVVSIELPTGLQLEQVDRHGIVGIERDVNGNEYVVAYAFQPPVATPR